MLPYEEAPQLHDVVKDLSEQAQIPHKPELYIYPAIYKRIKKLEQLRDPADKVFQD